MTDTDKTIADIHIEMSGAELRKAFAARRHDYLSTACYHGKHARCRLACKFCGVPCNCPCHQPEQPPIPPADGSAVVVLQ